MVEKGIGDDHGTRKMDVRIAKVHANGRGIGDEVDIVAASSQFHAEFGSYNARAPIGGVTGNHNTHRPPK